MNIKAKKMFSFLILLSMLFCFPLYALADTNNAGSISGAGLKITADKTLQHQGDKVTYTIIKEDGSKFESLKSFNDNYTVTKDLKIPLTSSDVLYNNNQLYLIVSSYVGNTTNQDYSGTITFTNKNSKKSVKIDLKGTFSDKIVNATSTFTVTNGTSQIYNFDNNINNYTISFGKDAIVSLNNKQKGNKVLTYNINPVDNVIKKYKLSSEYDYGFINFIGNPKFDSFADVKFYIPVAGDNFYLYRVKSNSKDGELEQLNDIKVVKNGEQNVFEFSTSQLAGTYIFTNKKINNVTAVVSASTDNNGNNELHSLNTESVKTDNGIIQNDKKNTPNDIKKEDSPKTGSKENIYMFACICLTVITIGMTVPVIYKKFHNN